jgi:hypothetical protein
VRDLAAWVLQDNPAGWDRAAIDAGIAAGVTKIINLPHKIPVAWVYLTGWVTRDGTVQFRDDVYKHDERLDSANIADAAAGGFVARVSRRPTLWRKHPISTAVDGRPLAFEHDPYLRQLAEMVMAAVSTSPGSSDAPNDLGRLSAGAELHQSRQLMAPPAIAHR